MPPKQDGKLKYRAHSGVFSRLEAGIKIPSLVELLLLVGFVSGEAKPGGGDSGAWCLTEASLRKKDKIISPRQTCEGCARTA